MSPKMNQTMKFSLIMFIPPRLFTFSGPLTSTIKSQDLCRN